MWTLWRQTQPESDRFKFDNVSGNSFIVSRSIGFASYIFIWIAVCGDAWFWCRGGLVLLGVFCLFSRKYSDLHFLCSSPPLASPIVGKERKGRGVNHSFAALLHCSRNERCERKMHVCPYTHRKYDVSVQNSTNIRIPFNFRYVSLIVLLTVASLKKKSGVALF